MAPETGKMIVLNGATSAGKSTLTLAAQQLFPIPLMRFSFDLFIDGDILPLARVRTGEFAWSTMRPSVLGGFYQCLPVLARAGNNLILDYIVESKEDLANLLRLLNGLDVFFVGLHCSLEELERREAARGNRPRGEARNDLKIVHKWTTYDLELNSEEATVEDNATQLLAAWGKRTQPTAFAKMAQELGIQSLKI